MEPRLFGLLWRASEISGATNGAFDITITPLMRAWGLAGGRGRMPSERKIAEALDLVGMERVRLGRDGFYGSVRARWDGNRPWGDRQGLCD